MRRLTVCLASDTWASFEHIYTNVGAGGQDNNFFIMRIFRDGLDMFVFTVVNQMKYILRTFPPIAKVLMKSQINCVRMQPHVFSYIMKSSSFHPLNMLRCKNPQLYAYYYAINKYIILSLITTIKVKMSLFFQLRC